MYPGMHVIYVSGYHTQPTDGRVLLKPLRVAELVAEVAIFELKLSSLATMIAAGATEEPSPRKWPGILQCQSGTGSERNRRS